MRVLIIGFLVLVGMSGLGQVTTGKIVFERKTNLLKKYTDDRMKAWLKDKKVKIDMFELYFNDTMSIFKPQESDLAEQMDWSTISDFDAWAKAEGIQIIGAMVCDEAKSAENVIIISNGRVKDA